MSLELCEMDTHYDNEMPPEYQAILDDPVERAKLFEDNEEKEYGLGAYEKIYDPGLGQLSIAKDIESFYGKEILLKMRKDLADSKSPESNIPEGQVSKQLYHEMKCMRDRTKPSKVNNINPENKPQASAPQKKNHVLKSKTTPREKQSGDDYFLKTSRGLIRNPAYREIFCGPETVYQWLWANIARKGWVDTDTYPLKRNYYDNGLLACTMSMRYIAENCSMNKNTVKKHIDVFEGEGIIKIDHWVPAGKKRGQNIYILGQWSETDGKIQENYYRDQVFMLN